MISYHKRPSVSQLRADLKSLKHNDFIQVGKLIVSVEKQRERIGADSRGEEFLIVSFRQNDTQSFRWSEIKQLVDEIDRYL